MEAKKKTRDFKFRNNNIYINEHLCPENRRIFGEASAKRKALRYKYIWTTNGNTHLRKDDGTPVITVKSTEEINNLR